MSEWRRNPVDLRRHQRRTERNLVIAVVVAFVVVGGLVIAAVYGMPAIFTGLLCLLPGAGVFVLLWLLLRGLEHITRDDE